MIRVTSEILTQLLEFLSRLLFRVPKSQQRMDSWYFLLQVRDFLVFFAVFHMLKGVPLSHLNYKLRWWCFIIVFPFWGYRIVKVELFKLWDCPLNFLWCFSFCFLYHRIFLYPSELVFYYPIIGGLQFWCSSCIFRWQISVWNSCSISGHHGKGIVIKPFFTIYERIKHDDINLTISICIYTAVEILSWWCWKWSCHETSSQHDHGKVWPKFYYQSWQLLDNF